ncbi:DUF6378 domain-containing protein [Halorubrum ezzemoulense]|uniref:DUF6378 domain-containing protein n=1 Tax=Halorubrum ezzemoulense TaxID=337243 RepID=UPI00232FFC89|nr:DUF6378 domain-containing protein [Halorubrum ezzemoulense]MDB9247414.1 DUF6378 domain-containing protein [Halorubrum ezzemoulense]MDB9258677.1 DUF6378 domain-containing protein [Halorubrum ezzemoulense]MDB9264465.1 DUF6378 domain-containing protein [Halorubrum ezzemoulense]MDB9269038.1 DUF6378 domain-containing protein [Halorubrum ezzemoulense]MDB9271433.1 DUF6378 domain-containing protein [Halorubrum ezzemoulense]
MVGADIYTTANVTVQRTRGADDEITVHVDSPFNSGTVDARELRDALDEYLDDGDNEDTAETTDPNPGPTAVRERLGIDKEDAEDALDRLAEGYQERAKQLSPEHNGTEPSGDERARRLLEDVGRLVDSDRDTHGDAVENQEHIASAWTWYLRGQGALDEDEELTGLDVAYMMALLKMSRNAVGEFDIDHPRDVAGYAGIGAACSVARGWADDDELEVADYGEHA